MSQVVLANRYLTILIQLALLMVLWKIDGGMKIINGIDAGHRVSRKYSPLTWLAPYFPFSQSFSTGTTVLLRICTVIVMGYHLVAKISFLFWRHLPKISDEYRWETEKAKRT